MLPNLDVPLRHADFTLEDHQVMVQEAFRSFFGSECPIERVREAPHGFDSSLWQQLQELRPVAMGVGEDVGGDGAGLVELVIAAEEFGRRVAPVPFVESVVAARLLARFASKLPDGLLESILEGSAIATFALQSSTNGRPPLVPAGAIADVVVGMVGDDLVVLTGHSKPAAVPNQADSPLARLDLGSTSGTKVVLARDASATAAAAEARREWQLIMGAAQVGIAQTSLDIAVAYARERRAFGTLIGAFQAIAHPLVDVAMATETARRLCLRAAWWADQDSTPHSKHIPFAYIAAVEAAVLGTKVGIHTLGGVGFTVESDLEQFFRCTKGWTLVAGDPDSVLDELATALYGPAA